jgi:hypothetical protein
MRTLEDFQTKLMNYQHRHPPPPYILCLTEHHIKTPEILQVNLKNYTLGASYCRQNMAKGGLSIFV